MRGATQEATVHHWIRAVLGKAKPCSICNRSVSIHVMSICTCVDRIYVCALLLRNDLAFVRMCVCMCMEESSFRYFLTRVRLQIGQKVQLHSAAFVCAWCKKTVHIECMQRSSATLAFQVCDMGAFAKFILPASSIILAPVAQSRVCTYTCMCTACVRVCLQFKLGSFIACVSE